MLGRLLKLTLDSEGLRCCDFTYGRLIGEGEGERAKEPGGKWVVREAMGEVRWGVKVGC